MNHYSFRKARRGRRAKRIGFVSPRPRPSEIKASSRRFPRNNPLISPGIFPFFFIDSTASFSSPARRRTSARFNFTGYLPVRSAPPSVARPAPRTPLSASARRFLRRFLYLARDILPLPLARDSGFCRRTRRSRPFHPLMHYSGGCSADQRVPCTRER